jgi:hypothetical protein
MFKMSLSAGGMNWEEGSQVYCRWAIKMSNTFASSEAGLLLQAIILPEKMESYPPTTLEVFDSGKSLALTVWEKAVNWFKPNISQFLPTTPGIHVSDLGNQLPPNDEEVRVSLYPFLLSSLDGMEAITPRQVEKWLAEPVWYIAEDTPAVPLVIQPSLPTSKHLPGRISCLFAVMKGVHCAIIPTIPTPPHGTNGAKTMSFTRKSGLSAKRLGSGTHLPKPTATSKFSTKNTSMSLSTSALPMSTHPKLSNRAKELFNSSISRATHNTYASGITHVLRAESELGRKFSNPPSPEDMTFLVTYLSCKNLSEDTVRLYLTAFRRLQLARGVHTPTPVPPLAQTLITGLKKLKHNPKLEVMKKSRRSISLPLLKLISHAIASNPGWSAYRKILIWSACLVAWWGGLRIGEMLPRLASEFSPKDALLRSDIRDTDTSIDLWVRNAKVPSQFGDLVQLWSLSSCPTLDPVSNLNSYLEMRSRMFGEARDLPVFIKENGKCLTKQEFNRILKQLLAQFSALDPCGVHSFTGHSFRAGLATMLASMGFSEDQIKAWGRWLSQSYLLYTKDKRSKMELQTSLLEVMEKVVSTSAA